MMLVGIVGKPSSGKTTFLNAACMTCAKVGNYPFTTIEPNPGVAYVRAKCSCQDLGVKCEPKSGTCTDGIRMIPVDMLDVAGLVPDAWQGKGLGNKFLNDLSRASGLIHVVDVSGSLNAEGQTIEAGAWNPDEDIKFLRRELQMWFADIVSRDWRRFIGRVELEKGSLVKALEEKLSGLSLSKGDVEKALRKADLELQKPSVWKETDFLRFASSLQEVAKPMIICANKIDKESAANHYLRLRKEFGENIIPCSTLGEYALRSFTDTGIIAYTPGSGTFRIVNETKMNETTRSLLEKLKAHVLEPYGNTGVQQCLERLVYGVLKMIVVYPVEDVNQYTDHHGRVLPDAFLVPEGTTAREFAYMIHTDLGKTFIHAIHGKTKRRLGEDYQLENGDIIKIVSAAGRK